MSYAAVLRGTGTLDRKAFFNYFQHGQSPGRVGGAWVRADPGEAKSLAAGHPARVKELDARVDGFLADTGATYPRPNPAFKGGE